MEKGNPSGLWQLYEETGYISSMRLHDIYTLNLKVFYVFPFLMFLVFLKFLLSKLHEGWGFFFFLFQFTALFLASITVLGPYYILNKCLMNIK